MITKNAALLSCIEMLEEFADNSGDHDQIATIHDTIGQAQQALALPNFPDDFEFAIESPDGIHIHPEAYPDLQTAIEAAAAFPLRFIHQGYYKSARMEEIEISELPKLITLEVMLKENEDEDTV